ncbi:MAG TPA: NAD(P)-binding domain-containing protein [Streptosporangiaceae bacterium]
MNVGFIGPGHMGGRMSRNVLAAGYDLTVYDVHREAVPLRLPPAANP